MNQIMIPGQGPVTMSSREIADLCEKQHKHVLRDIEVMIEQITGPKTGGSDTGPKFGLSDFEGTYRDSTGRTLKEYRLPRDLTVTLITGYRADLRYKVIKRLEELESRPALPDLSDPKLLTSLLLEHAAKRIEAEQRADAAEAKADAMQSDVEAHHRLTAADGSLTGTEAAKSLGIAPKELFVWLQTHGWIYRRPGSATWLGFQRRCNDGLLIHRVTTVLRPDGTERICEQVRITPKGLATLAKVIRPTAKLVVEN